MRFHSFRVDVATQVVIPFAASGTVDAPVVLLVEALDQFGNLATSESRSVRVVSISSPTVAAMGIVTFQQGIAYTNVSCTLPGVFTLSLHDDVQSTGLTVTSSNTITFAPGLLLSLWLFARY